MCSKAGGVQFPDPIKLVQSCLATWVCLSDCLGDWFHLVIVYLHKPSVDSCGLNINSVCVHVFMCMCLCVCVCVCLCAQMHFICSACMLIICVCMHMHAYACVCMHAFVCNILF